MSLAIIPTGNVRILRMRVQAQNAPEKLQMEFRDYDGQVLEWKDVPIVYADSDEFQKEGQRKLAQISNKFHSQGEVQKSHPHNLMYKGQPHTSFEEHLTSHKR